MARQILTEAETISFLSGFFRLQYAENPGAFLGLGAAAPEGVRYVVFIVSLGLSLAGLLFFLLVSRNISRARQIALSLLLGGGLGNLIDRLGHEGLVIDFMNVGIGSWRTGIFNVADIAILAGCLGLFIHSFKNKERAPLAP